MVSRVQYGPYELEPWYPSAGYLDFDAKYLKSYRSKEPRSVWQDMTEDRIRDRSLSLHVCSRCFLYSSLARDIETHDSLCRFGSGHPGQVVYDAPEYAIHEIECTDDSAKLYMQCLSLFGKMFLETKSICFAIDNFWIYALRDKKTNMVAGFFSKEKTSWFNYNLACIVVFPPFQRRGFGHAMIGYSYYLSRRSNTVGSPEQPLSSHGRKSYLAYWRGELCRLLLDPPKHLPRAFSLRDLARQTGIDPVDVAAALESMGALTRGRRGLSTIDTDKVQEYHEAHKSRPGFDEAYIVL